MQDFKKVVRIGKRKHYPNGRSFGIFCKVVFRNGRLSISGTEGPLASGNCRGSSGQIDMGYAHRDPKDDDQRYDHPVRPEDITFAPGWNKDLWWDFLGIWKHWHLNDMKAGCEHQRAEGWGKERVEVITYGLTSAGHALRKEALAEAQRAALAGEVADLDSTGKALLTDAWFEDRFDLPGVDDPLFNLFEIRNREKKQANRVKPEEHPLGVLGKPCPVCGYKYGSTWLKVEIPEDVLEFLRGLPDADKTPAWV